MSSKDFQVVKRMRRVQLNPQTSGGDSIKTSTKVRTIGSTRTGSKEKFGISQGASATVSGRELSREAVTKVRDRTQLLGRDANNSGESQTTKVSRTRFGFGSSGNESGNQNSRIGGGMTVQSSSRFGAGGASGSGSGSGSGMAVQSSSRFGAGGESGSGMAVQSSSRFGAGGASGSGMQYNQPLDLELEVQVDQEWQYNQPLDLEQELQEAELD